MDEYSHSHCIQTVLTILKYILHVPTKYILLLFDQAKDIGANNHIHHEPLNFDHGYLRLTTLTDRWQDTREGIDLRYKSENNLKSFRLPQYWTIGYKSSSPEVNNTKLKFAFSYT